MPRRVRRLGTRISTVRSERLLVERLDFDLSFRRFVGLGIDDRAWDASTFSKNRDRLLDGDVAMCFLTTILDRLQVKRLVSTEPFSVDGTLIKARASMKSFRRRDDGRSGEPPADGGSSGKLAEGRNAMARSTFTGRTRWRMDVRFVMWRHQERSVREPPHCSHSLSRQFWRAIA